MPAATAGRPWVDVTVRYRDRVLGTRRLGGSTPDSATPLRVGTLAVVLGLTLALIDILTGFGSLITTFEPVVLGGGLVGLGIIGLVVGFQRRAEPDGEAFWMGPASDVDVALERDGMPDRLAVARIVGIDVEVNPPPGFIAVHEGKTLDAEASFRLGPRSHLVLQDEDVEIELRRSNPGKAPPRFARPDLRLLAGVVLAGAVIGGTIAVAHFVMPDPMSIEIPVEHTAHGVVGDPGRNKSP